jgi:NADP-dependent 3-hydroxy acid dehydrogenase YdfG
VLVTGGTSGLGAEVTRRFVQDGAGEHASFVTGSVLAVEGGATAGIM